MTRGAVEVLHGYQSGGGADRCHRDNPEIRDHSARADNWLNQGFPEIGDYGTTRAPFRLNCDVKVDYGHVDPAVGDADGMPSSYAGRHPARCWSPCWSFGRAVQSGASDTTASGYPLTRLSSFLPGDEFTELTVPCGACCALGCGLLVTRLCRGVWGLVGLMRIIRGAR